MGARGAAQRDTRVEVIRLLLRRRRLHQRDLALGFANVPPVVRAVQ